MEIGIDSFAKKTQTNEGGGIGDNARAMNELIERIVHADKVGLDIFGIGEHHREEFLDSAVNGTDRPGLLHQLTRKIAQQNLQINSAKISTYGTSIVDVFYVKDLFGLKIQSDRRINIIKESMLDELKLSSEIVMTETTKPQTK